jgi:hypothetical protein
VTRSDGDDDDNNNNNMDYHRNTAVYGSYYIE